MRDRRGNNNVVYACRYRVVFCPKYRRKGLTPPIDERLKVILAEQRERWGQELQELIEAAVMPDHVHPLVGGDPQFGIHRLVKLLKGYSAHALRAEFPALRRRLPSLWTNSYFCATVGGGTLETLECATVGGGTLETLECATVGGGTLETLETLERYVENQKGR
jgi:putative transposase